MAALTCDEKPPLEIAVNLATKLLADMGASLRDLCTVKRRSQAEGFSFFSKTLPKLGKAFDRGLGDSSFKLPSSFKKWKNATEIPAFLGSFFRNVFNNDGTLRQDACESSIRYIRQICYAFYKYEVATPAEELDKQFNSWIEVDLQLPGEFEENDPVLDCAAELTKKIFGSFTKEGLKFKHGPGAVSDASRHRKYAKIPAIYSSAVLHFGLHTFLTRYEASIVLHSQLALFALWFAFDWAYEPLYLLLTDPQRSKLIGVPKDSRGRRLINEEPVIGQWYQQGIAGWTVDTLESHKLSKGSVNFRDQSVNRSLALEASLALDLATIDLREASDRVSLALVKRLFSRCPEYLSALLACRTPCAVVPYSEGEITHLLRKFSAMGSAVCFTTLAWTIYSIVWAELTLRGWTPEMVSESVHVYGDDLIVPKFCFELVSHALEKYGLLVNQDKSFVGSRFAESCGMDAFSGNCVTPVRVRKLINKPPTSRRELKKWLKEPAMAESVVKTVKLAQTMYLKGYWKSSEYLYSYAESVLGQQLPFGSVTSQYLCRLAADSDVTFLNRARLKPVVHHCSAGIRYCERTSFKALVVSPLYVNAEESGSARLRRVLPSMGSHSKLPQYGEFPDRGFALTYKRFPVDHAYPEIYHVGRFTGAVR